MRARRQLLARLGAALAALALAAPLPAYPLTLPQLLAMPLEDLLRVRIAVPARVDRDIRVALIESARAGFGGRP